jgi:hypothetical protein
MRETRVRDESRNVFLAAREGEIPADLVNDSALAEDDRNQLRRDYYSRLVAQKRCR